MSFRRVLYQRVFAVRNGVNKFFFGDVCPLPPTREHPAAIPLTVARCPSLARYPTPPRASASPQNSPRMRSSRPPCVIPLTPAVPFSGFLAAWNQSIKKRGGGFPPSHAFTPPPRVLGNRVVLRNRLSVNRRRQRVVKPLCKLMLGNPRLPPCFRRRALHGLHVTRRK